MKTKYHCHLWAKIILKTIILERFTFYEDIHEVQGMAIERKELF